MSIDRDQELAELRKKLEAANEQIEKLQLANKASEVADPTIAISEFEDTLKRLVQRVAMILQAEKCVILIKDKDSGELTARNPAFGIVDSDVSKFRVSENHGVFAQAFTQDKAQIFHDSDSDNSADLSALLNQLNVRNGVVVPLVVEKKDDDNRVINRMTIGVLAVFNKRYGGDFLDEDVTLLERLARNAAAVIANAQMFQELVEEKEKLAHTIESMYAGLLLISSAGKVIQMNARARQIFNVQVDPIGKEYKSVIDHVKCNEILEQMLKGELLPTHTTDDDEANVIQEIGVIEPETEEERIYQIHPAPVTGEDDRLIGTAIIMNDITEMRNLERMKTEFVAIAAHELRTPMTPIKGFISMLAQDEFDTFSFEERREYYAIIEQNVDRLGRLINDLLNVTRIERKVGLQFFWEETDLCALAQSVMEIQAGMTNTDKHPLVLDASCNPLKATVGKDQMEQILQNLVSNAIKYSPEGGEVRIIMQDEPDTNNVLIGVRDQGTGIPGSAKSKLFKPYRRIHNPKTASVKGTGIGLFLVKSLVEGHHGTIWVDSEMGKGTTFWYRIPKTPVTEEPEDNS